MSPRSDRHFLEREITKRMSVTSGRQRAEYSPTSQSYPVCIYMYLYNLYHWTNSIVRSICIYNILHSGSFMQATEPHSNCSLKRDIFPMYPSTFCSNEWTKITRHETSWGGLGQHYVKAPDWRYLSDLSGEITFGEKLNQLDPFRPYTSHSIILTWHHLRFFHPEKDQIIFQMNLTNRNMAQSHSYRNCHVGRSLPGRACILQYNVTCATF